MATLHKEGIAKRVQIFATTPLYCIFSSVNITEASDTVIDPTNFLGASVCSQTLIKSDNTAQGQSDGIQISTNWFRKFNPDFSTLKLNGITDVYVTALLSAQAVNTGSTVKSLIIVSNLNNIDPINSVYYSASKIQGSSYVIELVHNLSTSITVSNNTTNNVGFIVQI
jgi:hypothetical protein